MAPMDPDEFEQLLGPERAQEAIDSHKEVTDLFIQASLVVIKMDGGELLKSEQEAEDFGYLLVQELMSTVGSLIGQYTRKARGHPRTIKEWEEDAMRLGKRLLNQIEMIEEAEEAEWEKTATKH